MNLIRVKVACELIEKCLTPGEEIHARCTKGLPEGARLIHAEWSSPASSLIESLTSSGDVILLFEVPGPSKPYQRVEELRPMFGECPRA